MDATVVDTNDIIIIIAQCIRLELLLDYKHTYNALVVATPVADILAEFSHDVKQRIGRIYQEVRN